MDLTFSAPQSGPAPDSFDESTPADGAPPPCRIYGREAGAGGVLARDSRFRDFELVERGGWTGDLAETAGVVVLAVDDFSGREVLEFLAARGGEDGWVVLAPDAEAESFHVLSASYDYNSYEVGAIAAAAEDAPYVLDLRTILRDVSVARHDLNNPLTSALAETQLSLMDEPGGELQESLETIQRQLRRMRDLLKLLSPIRTRR